MKAAASLLLATGVCLPAANAADANNAYSIRGAAPIERAILAGLDNAPGVTVNRYCSSSLQTIRMAAHAIKAGEGDVFVANDPYHGGGHLPDYNVFAPVFADDPAAPTVR